MNIKDRFSGWSPLLADADTCVQRSLPRTNTPWNRHQGRQRGDKFNGSEMTRVAPSRYGVFSW